MDPAPDPDITIVILGKTGVGKSAAGNAILGRAAFRSELSFESVTTEVCEATGQVFGKRIRVIDTPGILDSGDSKQKMKDHCKDLVNSSAPCLFLVILRVGRFTREDLRAVNQAGEILGPEGLKKSYLLFTGGDALKNRTLNDFIFQNSKSKDKGEDEYKRTLPGVVRSFKGKHHLFDNEKEDQEQVRELLLKSGHLRGDVPVLPARLEERRILLLGRPGQGKSSSGNTILGSDRFRSGCDFNSVSEECVSESAEVEGRQVTVVDTPGLTDEVLTPKELYLQIMRSLVVASPGPHVFVIVVELGRIREADKRLFEMLPKLFGADASKYTMVLFTHGDKRSGGQSIDQMIQSNKPVSELVSMCGGRYCVFDNNQRGNRQQVRRFLGTVDQMVSENGGGHFTSEMFEMAETFIREERNLASPAPESSASGPAPQSSASGPAPESSASGPAPDRPHSGLSHGANGATEDKNILRKAWERLCHFVQDLWHMISDLFKQLLKFSKSAETQEYAQLLMTAL